MYQIKLFGPASSAEVEMQVNSFLMSTPMKLLDTKTRAESDDQVSITLVMATPRMVKARHITVLESPAGSENINYAIAMFKQGMPNLLKIEDVVIVPAADDHSMVYLKVIHTLKKDHFN